MICSTCKQHKNELTPRRSAIDRKTMLYLCSKWLDEKMEPRYLIIIHGKAQGFEAVSPWIKKRRYIGEEILASELV